MSIGASGRVVIEIDPELKRELYSALSREGRSLKDWFVGQAEIFTKQSRQLSFELVDRGAEGSAEAKVAR